ncbi:MAG TPA: diacylglycerol kinase family protein [Gemmatimonadales bacterium]|nr:diacylglycerol kinase family protein [Gemmatimonadales bacterium]
MILNPGSGSETDEDARRREIVDLFAAHGRTATIFAASEVSPIGDQARAAVEAGCRLAVAAGGDGTVNAVASTALEAGIPMAVLPVGTLNHFAKDLGLPLELPDAIRVAAQGAVRRVDVGEVNGRLFLNNSSIGVYPRIVELRNRYGGRGRAKWLAALWASLTVLRRRPFLGVRISAEGDVVVRRTPFVFVGNNEYRMVGLNAGSRESLTGGRLALYVMHASRRRGLLSLGWRVLWKGAERVDELELFKVEWADIETRRGRLQVALDGEVVVLQAPLRYRSRPAALQVVAA